MAKSNDRADLEECLFLKENRGCVRNLKRFVGRFAQAAENASSQKKKIHETHENGSLRSWIAVLERDLASLLSHSTAPDEKRAAGNKCK